MSSLEPIADKAHALGIGSQHLHSYGSDKLKVSLDVLKNHAPRGKLILVSAITPT
ncbi:MAG: formyltetrahydrofolate synthetase, partial [Verrucomicrobiaceae bacterium]|nr:formyltetrahydrofolate synthetase [Verrucomicrobiaceae bacterium]